MNKIVLSLECATGISGDMTVAALLDLGASKVKLLAALDSLDVDGYSVTVARANSHGVDACSFDVELEHEREHHGHERGHHHGHEALEHEHPHEAREHEHHLEHHGHERGHHHPHVHRNLADVTAILNSGDLTPRARELGLKIFGIVAEAESRAHGKPVEEVHKNMNQGGNIWVKKKKNYEEVYYHTSEKDDYLGFLSLWDFSDKKIKFYPLQGDDIEIPLD